MFSFDNITFDTIRIAQLMQSTSLLYTLVCLSVCPSVCPSVSCVFGEETAYYIVIIVILLLCKGIKCFLAKMIKFDNYGLIVYIYLCSFCCHLVTVFHVNWCTFSHKILIKTNIYHVVHIQGG